MSKIEDFLGEKYTTRVIESVPEEHRAALTSAFIDWLKFAIEAVKHDEAAYMIEIYKRDQLIQYAEERLKELEARLNNVEKRFISAVTNLVDRSTEDAEAENQNTDRQST